MELNVKGPAVIHADSQSARVPRMFLEICVHSPEAEIPEP